MGFLLAVWFGVNPQQFISWACPTPIKASGKMVALIANRKIFHIFKFFNPSYRIATEKSQSYKDC